MELGIKKMKQKTTGERAFHDRRLLGFLKLNLDSHSRVCGNITIKYRNFQITVNAPTPRNIIVIIRISTSRQSAYRPFDHFQRRTESLCIPLTHSTNFYYHSTKFQVLNMYL